MSAIELSIDGRVQAVFPLDAAVLSIGRNPECDILLADPKVSGLHAMISRVGDEFVIEDAASTNGLTINGQGRQSGTTLDPGDEILIAKRYLLTVVETAEAS